MAPPPGAGAPQQVSVYRGALQPCPALSGDVTGTAGSCLWFVLPSQSAGPPLPWPGCWWKLGWADFSTGTARIWGLVFNGDRLSVREDEKALELNGGMIAQQDDWT